MRPWLFEAKARERIYQQTDTHWNDRGALVAYQRIIEAVRARVPSTPPPWTRDDFEPVERDIEALDLAAMMGLKRVLRETDLRAAAHAPAPRPGRRPAGAKPTDELGRLVTEIDDPSLPRAVIFRDSFVSRLVPFLSEHFSRAVYRVAERFRRERWSSRNTRTSSSRRSSAGTCTASSRRRSWCHSRSRR